ncbi:restriction endonuclease subunit S [Pseudomonadales bacterium]|nr:restriction endonuclease subunit S [Pseudomonadales bacterium]
MLFKKTTLGDFADVQGGYAYKSKDLQPEGFCPVVKIKNVRDGFLSLNDLTYVNEDLASQTTRFLCETGDVLISMTGSGPNAPDSMVGRVARVKESDLPALINQRVGKLVIREKSSISQNFLYYCLSSKSARNYLVSSSTGSANQANINADTIKSLQIPKISYKESVEIGEFLSKFDDKIELNQKMNQTLEAIAKAIFKSWFVDFDPVRAKAEGRPTGLTPEINDLFPDALVDSEIGEIPEGWETTFLSNQLSFVLGGDWGKADGSDATPHECRCVRGADIANLQQFVWSDMPTRYLKESSFQKRSLQDWDIVFEISGGSPTQSTGRSVLITKQLLNAYEASVTTSNFCRLLRFSDPQTALFHYQKFRSSYDRDEFFMYETGTTGIKNFGFKYYSEDIPYALPPSALLDEFFEIAQPMIEKAGINMRENMVLSELRDTLLPKLISGELRIPDAEKFLEEAGI